MSETQSTQNLVPRIRFKGFTDAWEQCKLGNVVNRVTRKNKKLESSLPLTISAQYGLIDQRIFFNKTVASKDISGYFLVMNGEFAYNKSYSKNYPLGTIKRLDNYDMGVLSTLYIVFKPEHVDSDFLAAYYESTTWHREVSAVATEGARNHGLLNISPNDFFNTNITLPTLEKEQQKVGAIIKLIDALIASNQRKGEILRNLKKSLLQKMFVSKGHQQPGIRFSGYTDAWEQRKLKEIVTIMGGGTPKSDRSEFWDGKMVWFTPTEIGKKKYMTDSIRKITEDGLKHSSAKLLPKGTILFTSRASIGDVAITKTLSTTNQGFQSWIPEDGNSEFFYYLAQNIKPIALRLSSGSTFREISSSNIKNISVNIPSSKIEEEKIGKFLGVLDSTIASNQRKGEILQNLKKALLQKMFV